MTLVDASHTPDQPTPEPRVSEAGSAKIPLRARFSFLRQRIILTVRYWFRLPIDDVKEQMTQAQIAGLVELNTKHLETIRTLVSVSNSMQKRLQFYEANIPRMRALKREYDAEQERLAREANGGLDRADLSNGMLPQKPSSLIHLS